MAPANLPAKPPPPSAFGLRRHRVSRGAHNIYARGCIGRPQRAAAAVRRSADQASRPSAMPFYTDGLPCSHRRVPWDQYCKSGCLGEVFAVPRAAPLLSPLPSRGAFPPLPRKPAGSDTSGRRGDGNASAEIFNDRQRGTTYPLAERRTARRATLEVAARSMVGGMRVKSAPRTGTAVERVPMDRSDIP